MSVEAKASSGCRNWVVEMEGLLGDTDKVKEKSRWEKHTIHRVPEWLKETNPSAYIPELVSLGPFHHGRHDLLPMEEHKRRAMLHLVKRSSKPLQEFVDAVAEVAEELMDAYQDLDLGATISWRQDKDGFVKMMVMDGCFLVEVMRMQELGGKLGDYAPNDPVFSEHGFLYIWSRIIHDIIAIENQLPLLLIKRILDVRDGEDECEQESDKIYVSVLDLLDRRPNGTGYIEWRGLHCLDILHSSFTYTPLRAVPNRQLCCQLSQLFIRTLEWLKSRKRRRPEDPTKSESMADIISMSVEMTREAARTPDNTSSTQMTGAGGDDNASSAKKMREAGICFKKSKSNSFLDIHLGCCGVLHMPCLRFDGDTTVMLLNMMAFERLHADVGNDVTAYVYFMDDIIDTVKDVEVLKDAEIIRSEIGSDKELAMLFNNTLNRSIVMSTSSKLNKVRQDVYAHCKKRRNKWRANLIDTHFSNPWVFISFVAAVILLGATLVQTFCAVRKCQP